MFGDDWGLFLLFGFAVLIACEALVSRLAGRPAYDLASSEINLGVAFGWLLLSPLTAFLVVLCISFGNRVSPFAPGDGLAAFALLFLAADGLYYFWHVANHKFRWLWATHVVHHTAPRINFLAAFRQGWTDVLSGTWIFFAPLGLLGFSPEVCFVYFGVLHVWQLFAHNEWTRSLGSLEWVFVTPSNHRVHHSLKPEHIDRNFGGILILWDRLFGTYAAEGPERLSSFGIAGGPPKESGVFDVVLWGWYPIFSDLRKFAGRLIVR